MAALRSPSVRSLFGGSGVARRLQSSPIPRQLQRSKIQFSSSLWTNAPRRLARPTITATSTQLTSTLRQVSSNTIGPSPGGSHGPYDKRNIEAEKKAQQTILKATPETVSSTSSVQSIRSPPNTSEGEVPEDVDMLASVRADVVSLRSRRETGYA